MWIPRPFRRTAAPASEDFLSRNGALLLQMQISLSQGRSNPIRHFTFGDLRDATSNFDATRLLNSGVQGYYRGILEGRRVVIEHAGSASHGDGEERLVEALITQIVILSNARHRNIAKLLGCCLESRVPILVYDCVPEGRTLLHCLQDWRRKSSETPPWPTRLQIATDVADALSYLHLSTSTIIVHREVKATNVILDVGYSAILVGFRRSVPIPPGKTHVKEDVVCRPYGSVDPEFAFTGVLTEKTDVYGFGRLLLELLTGVRLPEYLNFEGHGRLLESLLMEIQEDSVHLSPGNFPVDGEGGRREAYPSIKEECLAKLVADAAALGDAGGKRKQLKAVAELALLCTCSKLKQRPAMKQVVGQLRRIRDI